MTDEFHDPVWAATKKGGKIGGCLGCSLGFILPWGLMALAFVFYTDETEIGALIPFLPIVLAPLGFVVLGLVGMAFGYLVGILRRRTVSNEPTVPPIADP
jgi:hypothetical protein